MESNFGTINTIDQSTFDDVRNARAWKFFFDKISATWRHGASDYISVGQYLIEAKDELQNDAYRALLTKLGFNTSLVKKLTRIAKNETLGSHVNLLPPCYSTIYCLSQLSESVLEAAFADGSIHPGMMRKDAIALKPTKTATKSASAKTPLSDLNLVWKVATPDQRCAFFDLIGRDGICTHLPRALMTELRDPRSRP